MNEYSLEHILSFTGIGSAAPDVIGPLPEGTRVNFHNSGGEVKGPKIRGLVRPTGGDWMTVRRDGVAVMDARVTFETDDKALIFVTYGGTIDFGPDGYDQFLRGEMPEVVRLRISPRFATGADRYLWLTRVHCVGIGEYRPATRIVSYDVYAVR